MIVDFGRHELYLQLTDNYIDGIHAVQGETSRQIKFILVDAVGRVRDATGLKLIMTVALKGGIDQMEAMGNTDGEFVITLTPGMLSRYGKADYQLILTKNNEVLASVIGKLHIERNIAYDSGDGINILLDFAELKQVMDLAKTINKQVVMTLNQTISEREKAEECSNTSCKCAKEAQEHLTASRQIKTDLADVFDTENARKLAEQERAKAETTRQNQESGRVTAENERDTAETKRENQESARKTEETKRVNAENDRTLEEQKRESAETTRQNQESGRVTAENKRESAEGNRIKQYQDTKALLEVAGSNPNVQMAQEIADIKSRGGGRNLLLNSGEKFENEEYPTATYSLTKPLAVGKTYTVSLKGKVAENRQFMLFGEDGNKPLTRLEEVEERTYRKVFTVREDIDPETLKNIINVYTVPKTETGTSIIDWIMLEEGTVAHDWSPAPEDLKAKADKTDLDKKVNKTPGKMLSSNDYTDIDKQKVDGIPVSPKYTDTTYTNATTSDSGLMSASDKVKLDNTYPIAIIDSGGSTVDIPNGTIILELE